MTPHSKHAPAERASWDELHQQMVVLQNNKALQGLVLDSPEQIILLNLQRQIVYVNKAFLKMTKLQDPAEIYSCRLGETIRCAHSAEGEGGCGTGEDCRNCGAVNAMLNTLQDQIFDMEWCSIPIEGQEKLLNFIAFTMPVRIAPFNYILMALVEDHNCKTSTSQLAKHAFIIQRMAADIERG